MGLNRDTHRHESQASALNVQLLDQIIQTAHTRRRWGYPKTVRTDNGPEFTCRAFMTWAQKHDIQHILIEPGSPTQNAHTESLNGTFRDERLHENWFESLEQARPAIATCRFDYNETRPDQTAQQLWVHTARDFRRIESAVN